MVLATMMAKNYQRVQPGTGGGNPSTFAFPFTPPTGMNVYGAGSPVALTLPSLTPTGVYRDVTNDATMSAAIAAYQQGDIIRVMKNSTITAGSANGYVFPTSTTVTQYVVIAESIIDGTLARGRLANPEGAYDIFTGAWVEPSSTARANARLRPSDCVGTLVPIVQTANTASSCVFRTDDSSAWVGGKTQPKVWIEGLEIRLHPSIPALNTVFGLVWVGGFVNHTTTTMQVGKMAPEFVLNACYLHASAQQNLRRGVIAQGLRTCLINSWVEDIHEQGFNDCNAFWASTVPGPFKVVNNHLGCSGEVVMFGGSDPVICDAAMQMYPSNCLLKWNDIWENPLINTNDPGYAAGPYNGRDFGFKNLTEAKNFDGWWIEGNVYRNSRVKAQTGSMFLFQALSDNNRSPWTRVQNIAFRYNDCQRMPSAVNYTTPCYPNRSFSNLSNTAPIVVTMNGHGYPTGTRVRVADDPDNPNPIVGNRAAIGNWTITAIDANNFSLDTSVGNGTYVSGGRVGVYVYAKTNRVEFCQNLFGLVGTEPSVIGSNGWAYNSYASADTVLRRCTFDQGASSGSPNNNRFQGLDASAGTCDNFVCDGVLAMRGSFGIFAQGPAEGLASITATCTATNNYLLAFHGSTASTGGYTGVVQAGTRVLFNTSRTTYMVDPDNGDFTVKAPYQAYGCDWAAVQARTAGVVVAP